MNIAFLNPLLPVAQANRLINGLTDLIGNVSIKTIRPGIFVTSSLPRSLADTQITQLKNRLDTICTAHQIDFALLPLHWGPENFKLLAMDMDSTLITIECIDEIADFIGKKKEVAAITEATMRGDISSFSESLTQRVALLAGISANNLESVFNDRLRLSDGAANLLQFARQQHWKTLLVSGGFTYFTQKLQSQLDLDYSHANTLEIIDNTLTGRVIGRIVDAQTKADHLKNICTGIGITPDQALVLGDGANDLKMMAIAGTSIAYKAKPIVRAQTCMSINFNGLDTVLAWFEAAKIINSENTDPIKHSKMHD